MRLVCLHQIKVSICSMLFFQRKNVMCAEIKNNWRKNSLFSVIIPLLYAHCIWRGMATTLAYRYHCTGVASNPHALATRPQNNAQDPENVGERAWQVTLSDTTAGTSLVCLVRTHLDRPVYSVKSRIFPSLSVATN